MRVRASAALTAMVVALATPAAAQEAWARELGEKIERQAEAFARFVEEQVAPRGQRRASPRPDPRPEPEVTEEFSRNVRLGRNGTLDLENLAGNIAVTGGGGDDVRIQALKRARRSASTSAENLVREVQIEVTERGGNVVVRTQYPWRRNEGRSISVDYTVSVPREAHLTLKTVSGDIRITNVRGDVRADSVSGDISASSVERVRGLRAISGNVQITDVDNGEIEAGAISGDVIVRNVNVRTLEVQTVSGNLRVIDAASERANLQTVNGDIEFEGRLARNGRYEISSHSGNVRVTPAGNASFELEATTFSGNVVSDFQTKTDPGGFSFNGGRGRPMNRTIRGTVGDGDASLVLQSFSGDVRILRTSR